MRRLAMACLLPLVGLVGACDPCEGETCSGHGTCVVVDGKAVCECDDGFGNGWDNPLSCEPFIVKPILYLYPEQQTEVTVRFRNGPEGLLTHSYPEYGPDGWTVVADPDGTLHDSETGMEYYGLYWEGAGELELDLSKGFVVERADTAAFLEQRLAALGLNRREANEFIIYWLPRMERYPYNRIHFATSQWNELVPLDIQPAPDSLIRVYMVFQGLPQPQEIEPQELSPVERTGFTVVEWGGSEH